MSSTNPVLGMAVYSLMNALELYQKSDQKSEERRRFGAIILMDLSVEYILKAKLYQLDTVDFLANQKDMGFSDVLNDKRISFVGDEKTFLSEVHKIRNYAQHRVSIPDSLGAEQDMKWLCKFFNRFSTDNFDYEVIYDIPFQFKSTWARLTFDVEKTTSGKSFELKLPLNEHYKTVKNWIRVKEQKSKRGMLVPKYKNQILFFLKKFCDFVKKNPDEMIDSATKGFFSPDEALNEFLKNVAVHQPYILVIKSFFRENKVALGNPVAQYKTLHNPKAITTEQIRRMLAIATPETISWILANSYMGLKVGELALLTVEDFHVENWGEQKNIYPVTVREEVSNTFDHITFIGQDAKIYLERYFKEKGFSPQDTPWKHKGTLLSSNFRNYAIKSKVLAVGNPFTIIPKSLTIRLRNILEEYMRQDWICHLFGVKPPYREDSRPMDWQIEEAYEKALPKLKIFDVEEVLHIPTKPKVPDNKIQQPLSSFSEPH